MKIRSGFVSNSSSSSFVIGVKDRSLKELADEFKIEFSDNPLTELLNPMTKSLIDTLCSSAREVSLEEWLSDWGYESVEEASADGSSYCNKMIKLFEKGFRVYTGSFSDECASGAEMALCYASFKVERDDFYADKDGGY